MKIELGSKLYKLFLSKFAEFTTVCMQKIESLFVNFSGLIAAMEMRSRIMIFLFAVISEVHKINMFHNFLFIHIGAKVWQFSLNLAAAAKDLPLPRDTILQSVIGIELVTMRNYYVGVSWYLYCYNNNGFFGISKLK